MWMIQAGRSIRAISIQDTGCWSVDNDNHKVVFRKPLRNCVQLLIWRAKILQFIRAHLACYRLSKVRKLSAVRRTGVPSRVPSFHFVKLEKTSILSNHKPFTVAKDCSREVIPVLLFLLVACYDRQGILFLNSNSQDEILVDKHMWWKTQALRVVDGGSLHYTLISVMKEEAWED